MSQTGHNMEQTIRAVNKKTGEVFEGSVEEARKFGFSDEFILNKLKTAQELEAQMGGGQPKKVEGVQDVLRLTQELGTGGERTKAQDAIIFAEQVKNALDSLSESEKEGILGAKGSGPLVNLLSGGAEKLGVDTKQAALRDNLDNLRQLIRKERTGVQFSEKELKELESIFGSIKTQEAPLRRKLEQLLARSVNEAAAKTGANREDIEQVLTPQAAPEKESALNKLFGQTRGILRDVVATPGATAQNTANQNLVKNLEVAQQQSIESGDTEQLAALQRMFQDASGGAQQTAETFSPQVQYNPLVRGLLSGSEVAAAAEAPARIYGAKNVVTRLPNVGKSALPKVGEVVRPIKTAGKARTAAAEALEKTGEKISSDGLQQIAQEMLDAKVVTRTEKEAIEALAKGEGAKPTEALKLLVKAGKKSFTKSGDPRITKAADFYSILRDELRDQFSEKAPEVIKQTSKMARTKSLRKGARSAATTTGLAAGGVGGGAYLLNLLRKGVTGGGGN